MFVDRVFDRFCLKQVFVVCCLLCLVLFGVCCYWLWFVVVNLFKMCDRCLMFVVLSLCVDALCFGVVRWRLRVACCALVFVVCCSLLIVMCWLLVVARGALFVVRCVLFVVCYLVFVVACLFLLLGCSV